MSINVTVHGNPISIKKGKMVTCDGESEFNRRRLIRLQQVRQQSKEIAADVRNRVRKEKERQVSKSEQKGEQDLKRWKQRKLLALQHQYEDCVKDIGAAHATAAAELDPKTILYEQAQKNQMEAGFRGKKAQEKLAQECNEKRKKSEQLKNIRRNARKIENERSLMVAALNRSKKKKKKKRKKIVEPQITVVSNDNLETFNMLISDEENISTNIIKDKEDKTRKSNISIDNRSPECCNALNSSVYDSSFGLPSSPSILNDSMKSPSRHRSILSPNKTPSKEKKDDVYPSKQSINSKRNLTQHESNKNMKSYEILTDSEQSDDSPLRGRCGCLLEKRKDSDQKYNKKSSDRSLDYDQFDLPLSPERSRYSQFHRQSRNYDKDNRKKCEMLQDSNEHLDDSFDMNEDNCHEVQRTESNIHKTSDKRTRSNIRRDSNNRQNTKKTNKSIFNVESYKICDIPAEKETPYLPYVPTTTVQPESEIHPIESQESKVKYYDKLNHFGKEYTAKPVIQKITKGSIKVNPSTEKKENEKALKLMQSRDKIAHNRGVKAMEKEKIQKDYKQLMEELPVLQRQEQLAQMRTHNPAFHMNEERLEELEKRRQNKLENIFEKYYNKTKVLETPLVTIRPIQKTPPADEMKLPFRALDVTESPLQLNVADWKNEYSERDHQIQEDLENKQKALVDLLQRVNKQRELLLKEVSTLPPTSNLQKILHEDEILKLCLCEEDIKKKTKKVRTAKIKDMISTGTSPVSVKSPSKSTQCHKKCGIAISSLSSSNSSSDTSTHNKRKHKKQKILIRNEGTQTSPLLHIKSSSPEKNTYENKQKMDKSSEKITAGKKCTKCCYKCVCTENEKENPEKLCEIVIQMNNKSDIKICESEDETAAKKVVLNVSKPTKISIRSPQNVNDMSSSTTYNSLPEYQRKSTLCSQKVCKQNIPKPALRTSRQKFKEMLHDKPQQTNIDNKCKQKINTQQSQSCKKEITPNLLRYIQKLLSMSRQSIDELTISSISSISTPGNSVIDNVENNTLSQLQNVMQYYNLNFNDIQKHLSVSESSKTSIEESTIKIRQQNVKQKHESTIFNSDVADETDQFQKRVTLEDSSDDRISPRASSKKSLSPKDATEKKCSPKCPEQKRASPQFSSEISQSRQSSPASSQRDEHVVKDNFDINTGDAKDIPYINILSKYKELTETCCDRISKLTEMIDNVRLEKERLLSPENSDKYETSITSYLDLPKMFDPTRVKSNSNKSGSHSNSSSTSSSSISQEALDRYLLSIDTISKEPTCNIQCNANYQENDEIPGIPKYVEPSKNQAMDFLNSPVKQFLLNSKSKPPPALLRNVNRYNLDINMTPHELSTIIELDTIVSSRNISEVAIIKQRSPEKKLLSREENNQEDTVTEKEASGFVTLSPENFKTSPKEQKIHCKCKSDNNDETSTNAPYRQSSIKKSCSRSPSQERPSSQRVEVSGVAPLPSELSASSPEDMELILRNMGLGWAVSTLKKTHEALALSSSSSSVEASFRKRVSFKNSSSSSSSTSNSDSYVSLKNIFNKELMRKISSSTLVSNSSGLSPNLQELEDISEIRDPTVLNRDASQHRTSTPVQNSKSTDSKKELFTGDSDISSVRLQSEEFFLSIPNVSLSSTNKSLSKSKQ